MNRFLKKAFSCIMVAALLCVSLMPIGASAANYPEGVTSAQAEDAIDNTDTLINGLLKNLSDTTLKDMVMPELCSDKVVSLIMLEIYKSLEANSDKVSALGLNITVRDLAAYLSVYPQVSARLSGYTSWSQVNLDGVEWGVNDKRSFATALSAVFGPLNSLIYALVCGGTYPIIGALVGITGARGYENAIVPIFDSLGCTDYMKPADFYAYAATDRHLMVRNVALDLLDYIEKILEAPATMLSENLPSIAYFVNNGGLESAISELMAPMKISVMGIPLFNVDSFIDLGSLEGGLSINLDLGNISVSDFKTAPLDLELFASCGTVEGNRVTPRKGEVYIEFLRWVLETVKLNQSFITGLINSNVTDTGGIDINAVITNLLEKPTDEIISMLVNILASEGGEANNYQWRFSKLRDNTAVYTENLTKDDFERAMAEVDELVDQFVAEGGEYTTLREMLEPIIYSNSLLSEVVIEVYKLLQGEDVKNFVELLGVELAPYSVAKTLTEEQFSVAANQLANLSSWNYANKDILNWGFEDGDREGFINAVTAMLRPADGIFRMLLAGGKISLLGSIDFYGSDGYNTAVIPLLEALGVYGEDILSYDEYLKKIANGDAIRPILDSVFSLLDRVMDKPVHTVTQILPNLMYFLNNGGLSVCAKNIIYPIMSILNKLGLEGLIDFSMLTNVDVNALIAKLTQTFEISFSFAELNLSQFEGMGELVTTDSKRTQSGMPIQIYSVKSSQADVLVTLLRYAVETIKLPGNDRIILSLVGDSELGSNSMVSSFAKGISDNINSMTVDETLEWVFNIFFAERVVSEEVIDDGYVPEVTYNNGKRAPSAMMVTILAIVFMLVIVILLTNRDKIKFRIQDMAAARADKK